MKKILDKASFQYYICRVKAKEYEERRCLIWVKCNS